MNTKTDKELMKLIAEKNSLALKTLYQRYNVGVFNFVLRYTGNRELAQELIQETFTRIWTAARQFDQRKGNFRGWLFTIALNLTRTEMSRKEYTYRYLDVDEVPETHHRDDDELKEDDPHTLLEKKELKHTVAKALGKLPAHMREVIIMKNYHHLKFREIAAATNTPEGTLKARYHRAVAALKGHLSPKDNITTEVNHA